MTMTHARHHGEMVAVGQVWQTPCGNFNYQVTGIKPNDLGTHMYVIQLERTDYSRNSTRIDTIEYTMSAFVRRWKYTGITNKPKGDKHEEEECFVAVKDPTGLVCQIEMLIEEMAEEDEFVHPEYIRGRLEQILKSEIED